MGILRAYRPPESGIAMPPTSSTMAACLVIEEVRDRPTRLMLFGVFLYFVLVVVILALVCLPPVRERAVAGLAVLWRGGRSRGAAWRRAGRTHAVRRAESAQDSGQRLLRAT